MDGSGKNTIIPAKIRQVFISEKNLAAEKRNDLQSSIKFKEK